MNTNLYRTLWLYFGGIYRGNWNEKKNQIWTVWSISFISPLSLPIFSIESLIQTQSKLTFMDRTQFLLTEKVYVCNLKLTLNGRKKTVVCSIYFFHCRQGSRRNPSKNQLIAFHSTSIIINHGRFWKGKKKFHHKTITNDTRWTYLTIESTESTYLLWRLKLDSSAFLHCSAACCAFSMLQILSKEDNG